MENEQEKTGETPKEPMSGEMALALMTDYGFSRIFNSFGRGKKEDKNERK